MPTPPREVFGDRFYDLLEASAEEARHSLQRLAAFLKARSEGAEDLATVRRKSEQVAAEISRNALRCTPPFSGAWGSGTAPQCGCAR
jgi:hypothetical protein